MSIPSLFGSGATSQRADLLDRVVAFFDPKVAVHNGELVEANGLFDTGDDGSAPYTSSSHDPLRQILYGNDLQDFASDTEQALEDPVSSATGITSSNNAAGQEAVNNANQVNQATTEDAFNKYLQSLEYLGHQNISSAEKIMKMNEQAQINAYNRNLSYIDEYYPRLIKSLKSAGINPILMASRGFGSPNTVSSAANVAAPYISSPSQLTGFASDVAKLDFNTAVDVFKTVLTNEANMDIAQANRTATVLASLFTALGKVGAAAASGE